jgi:hypothetical protein
MENPIFQGAGATPNMYSMLTHKQNIVPPPILLCAEFCYELSMLCAFDGMLRAGKLLVFKQLENVHHGLGMYTYHVVGEIA